MSSAITTAPLALLFSGQASAWSESLRQAAAEENAEQLRDLLAQAHNLLTPVVKELTGIAPGAYEKLTGLINGQDTLKNSTAIGANHPAISVPGILLTQIFALWQLETAGLSVKNSPACGYSQGKLGVASLACLDSANLDSASKLAEIVATSLLIGYGAANQLRVFTGGMGISRMISIRGIPLKVLRQAGVQTNPNIPGAKIALKNGPKAFTLSGQTNDLAQVRSNIETITSEYNAKLQARLQGGSALEPIWDELPIAVPFHTPELTPALKQVIKWADQCRLDKKLVTELATGILIQPQDWTGEIAKFTRATKTEKTYPPKIETLVNIGPGQALEKITKPLIAGGGLRIIDASTIDSRDELTSPGYAFPPVSSWEQYAPKLIQLPDGTTVIETAFTKLTGNSPILLAAMTPTTVDPEIVAAAANAGHWAEIAGGGQYSPEVFNETKDGLISKLKPGCAAQFNSMYFDRFMWNLQFGTQKIVAKARAAGAPINGVTISAGIPETTEATDIIETLTKAGFPYISFKPGTIDQIKAVLQIADANPNHQIIMQVEDGHAGGHHSWVNLHDLLQETYAQIRMRPNVVLCVGGGIGTPQRAADYISGQWSTQYNLPPMPVDGILVGTAAMTTLEAKTSPQVKELLKNTRGIALDEDGGWVGRGQSRGGVTSGLSHLHADMYELDNDSAACSRLLAEVGSDPQAISQRHGEIIAALNKTAKPYFGDVREMTYAQWVERFLELVFPSSDEDSSTPNPPTPNWPDPTWLDRYFDLLRRIEARLTPQDHGEMTSLFASIEDIEDSHEAYARLRSTYLAIDTTMVGASDASWFITLCQKHHKPLPFVPVIDGDVARWWGLDTLWQSQDPRYSAQSVRVIPGPVSVAGIDRVDEPVAQLLGRFEKACVERLSSESEGQKPKPVFSRYASAADEEQYLRTVRHIVWNGHLINNPATLLSPESYDLRNTEKGWELVILCDTYWDSLSVDAPYSVREVSIPLSLPATTWRGAVPHVSNERLPAAVYGLLSAVAGIGSTTAGGDLLTELPQVMADESTTFGVVHHKFSLNRQVWAAHVSSTCAILNEDTGPELWSPLHLADALVGPCWPATYAALGSAYLPDGLPVIEGLLNAVHLDHCIDLHVPFEELFADQQVDVRAFADPLEESASGRIVTVNLELSREGKPLAKLIERFAIRGRITSSAAPSTVGGFGGQARLINPTSRSFLTRVKVRAPKDMTPFAVASGDYNPIHTSTRAAALVDLKAPLVHGMWLSAVAQGVACVSQSVGSDRDEGNKILGWTYSMYGMVQLGDEIEILVERVGRFDQGGTAVEVTCRIGETIVSRGQGIFCAPITAYVYPGQGIQQVGMGKQDRQKSVVVRELWNRADQHTRSAHGFSIVQIIDENPTELRVKDQVLRHPEGVMNLTQFTQVALAVVAYGQTARLAQGGALVEGAFYAGHSLGEYTALASCANIFELESVIDVVYSRGAAMHALVERDDLGRSNYRLGALRPDQCGISAEQVGAYIDGLAQTTGEFLQIVNYNLEGKQYAVAGTVAGLEALMNDAAARAEKAGGKNPFMLIPGIDVPFHSRVLRAGVPEFAKKLDELLPAQVDYAALVGRYIPNLVAVPFSLSRSFAQRICDEVPSQVLRALLDEGTRFEELVSSQPGVAARILLIELLSWQFASPVRWIETQDLLLCTKTQGGVGVEQVIEVGLGSAPTLANLADRTLQLPKYVCSKPKVLNLERDEAVVYASEAVSAPAVARELNESNTSENSTSEINTVTEKVVADTQEENSTAASSSEKTSTGTGQVRDIPYDAADALMTLFALQTKLITTQIGDSDTIDSLTNGVSSRRNQLLMDMSTELDVASIDGAAQADVQTLSGRVRSAVPGYKPYGPVLSEAIGARLRAIFGAAGLKPAEVTSRVTGVWKLPQSWVVPVEVALVLGTRDGESVRGGNLQTLGANGAGSKSEGLELIDHAIMQVADKHNIAVSRDSSATTGGGTQIDSAELEAYVEKISGENGALAQSARTLLSVLGLSEPERIEDGESGLTQAQTEKILATLDAELGSGWLDTVEPCFDMDKAVLFDDRWASAREELSQAGVRREAVEPSRFVGLGEVISNQAKWWAERLGSHKDSAIPSSFRQAAELALQTTSFNRDAEKDFRGEVALVTGAAPGSIGASVVAQLLAGGAQVIMTSSRISPARLDFARRLYSENAHASASLWLVPANMSSYRDVDALVEWITRPQTETKGEVTAVIKPALLPTLVFPFAAPSVSGSLTDIDGKTEVQVRLLLWSVERLIAQLAEVVSRGAEGSVVHVVLPGSPNRGIFGGDGAYGESKAAFDAVVNKWHVENGWPRFVTLAQPLIGWVSGTHLMKGNDALVPAAKEAGINVFTPPQIAAHLLKLCTKNAREEARKVPLSADLTGGLATANISLPELAAKVASRQAKEFEEASQPAGTTEDRRATIKALPSLPTVSTAKLPPDQDTLGEVTEKLEDMVVIVGLGEVSAWGSGRTRQMAEYGISRDGSVELTAAGVLELAWMMKLVSWSEDPHPGWYDASGDQVAEEDIYDRFRDEVVARCGIRPFSDDSTLVNGGSVDAATVYLDRDIEFSVPSREEAEDYFSADPSTTTIRPGTDGDWLVFKRAGATALVPKTAALTRTVGGQIPDDFDPACWGIPPAMLEGMDRIAAWNLVTAVDAFLSSGFTPAELLRAVHPTEVASTQGTGIGGMESLRQVFLSRFLGKDRPQDILQEALPNVVAAHVMQAYVGGYGSMIHPVAACATAAVSVEEGADKIRVGKARFVVAGGIDDISVESLTGFGMMNATADSAQMKAKGILERFFSRANDRRRAGFVEAAGGGTVLLARGDVAAEMGLPVLAVVAHAQSYADGSHVSIPAPGIGAIGAARGKENSPVAKALRKLGLTPDDVRVVSKHDTSTNANDPNESEIHKHLWKAVGRKEGNPLYVVSQKTVVGHAKGGAALFQISGLCEILRTGRIPANAALDCVDPQMQEKAGDFVWLREGLDLGEGEVKAAVLSSLGFGHVSAVIVLAHPACFEKALAASGGDVQKWRGRANARLLAGVRRLDAGMRKMEPLFVASTGRRLPEKGADLAEVAMLLDENMRLGSSGTYPMAAKNGQ